MSETAGERLRVPRRALSLICMLVLGPAPGSAEPGLEPDGSPPRELAVEVSVADTPNDDSSSLSVTWLVSEQIPKSSILRMFRQAEGETSWIEVGSVPAEAGFLEDTRDLSRSSRYRYRFGKATESEILYTRASCWVQPRAQWFNGERTGVAVALPLFCLIVVVSIVRARSGARMTVRRIPGLEAVDEAIGRATEMGKPILFSPGIDEADQPGTIAGLAILGKIMERAAASGTRTIVPNRDPVVMTVAREIGRQACLIAGKPEFYSEDDIYYATYSQFGYAAAMAGTMVRERPAVNFFMGNFAGEALILAETGYTTGAMQIAGCDSDTQLPFFLTTCDYTLIGEELYAASAYLSREPVLLGSLKGQDISKIVIILFLVLGVVLAMFGLDIGSLLR